MTRTDTAAASRPAPGRPTPAPTRRLAEVAKKVGVSEATVSRVLNARAGVSAATRGSVRTVSPEELLFEAELVARGSTGSAPAARSHAIAGG